MGQPGDAAPAVPFVPVPTALILDDTISAHAKVLWAALYQVQQTGGGGPFEMTLKEIIGLVGGAKGSVITRKKELVDAGWLAEAALRGLNLANLYEVLIPGQVVPVDAPVDH